MSTSSSRATFDMDSEDAGLLGQMLVLASEYIEEQDEGDVVEAAAIAAMQTVQQNLIKLLNVEAAETEPPEDEAPLAMGRKPSKRRGDNPGAGLHFTVSLGELKCAASGDPQAAGSPTVSGRAAVYGMPSHDLGGFRVMIQEGAFTRVLGEAPDVHLLWDHDTRYTLARTKNGTLELREDADGLRMWARLADVSYAKDVAELLRRGDMDQMSFACDIAASTWAEDDAGNITQTITEVESLYDVTICAQGAFPQTSSTLVASVNDAGAMLASAREAGLLATNGSGDHGIAPGEGATDVARVTAGGRDLSALKQWAEARYAQTTDSD